MMAKPCEVCGTTAGAVHPKTGKPRRIHGCCGTCDSRIAALRRRHGLATFEEARALDGGRKFTVRVRGDAAEREPVPTRFAPPHFREPWEGDE